MNRLEALVAVVEGHKAEQRMAQIARTARPNNRQTTEAGLAYLRAAAAVKVLLAAPKYRATYRFRHAMAQGEHIVMIFPRWSLMGVD